MSKSELSRHLAKIGQKGGRSKSLAKKKAALRNLAKANINRKSINENRM